MPTCLPVAAMSPNMSQLPLPTDPHPFSSSPSLLLPTPHPSCNSVYTSRLVSKVRPYSVCTYSIVTFPLTSQQGPLLHHTSPSLPSPPHSPHLSTEACADGLAKALESSIAVRWLRILDCASLYISLTAAWGGGPV